MNYNCNYNKYSWEFESNLEITDISVVHNSEDVKQAIEKIYERCQYFPVVGLDCEWTPTRRKNQQPNVALLQLATVDGFCVLIRTCRMTKLPSILLDFLKDRTIIKVGVGIFNDGNVLRSKFPQCKVYGLLDIRYLTRSCNVFSKKESLKELTRALLSHDLGKDNVLCYDWHRNELDKETILYAALDALAGVKIFERLLPLFHEQLSEEPFESIPTKELIEEHFLHPKSVCARIFDKKFK